jgi:ribonuclease HI
MTAKNSEFKKVIVYTDGACTNNPGPGGYGVVLLYNKHEKELSEGFRLTTSNRMEIWAAIAALEALKTKCAVTIYSDSKYLVDSVSQGWMYRWKANGWKQKENEVSNTDLWKQLLKLCQQHEVEFVWVKGHDGNPGNERADQLSRRAADQENLVIDTIYEKEEVQAAPPTLFKSQGTVTFYQTSKPHTTDTMTVELEGKSYMWNGSAWHEATTFLSPPGMIIPKLNNRLSDALEEEDRNIADVHLLIKRAVNARDWLQYSRSEKLARRILELEPSNEPALAILCATLRARGFAQKALAETDDYKSLPYPVLLTSRAAASCDLGKWEEAKKTVGRSLVIRESEEAHNVVNRIKAARPDLY